MTNELAAFWPENCCREAAEVIVSARFKGADGKPIAWVIEPLSAADLQAVCREGGARRGLGLRLLARAVSFPDLQAAELQDSYGVMGAEQLLLAMLSPGEFQVLEQAFIDLNLQGAEE